MVALDVCHPAAIRLQLPHAQLTRATFLSQPSPRTVQSRTTISPTTRCRLAALAAHRSCHFTLRLPLMPIALDIRG